MFWLGWLIMSMAASDFSLLSDRALHDNPLVAGKLVLVRLGEVEAHTQPTQHTKPRTPLQCRKPRMRPLEHWELCMCPLEHLTVFSKLIFILTSSSERNISLIYLSWNHS